MRIKTIDVLRRLPHLGLGVAFLLTAATPARAQDLGLPAAPAAGAPAADGAAVESSEEAKRGKEGKKDKEARKAEAEGVPEKAPLEFHGRVFAQTAWERQVTPGPMMMTDVTTEGIRFSVPSARAGLKARPHDKLTLALEVDFAPKPAFKDAFIQTKHKHWAVRAGQFKMPISSFSLESPWTLPLARRGMIHEFVSNDLQLFGRRPGLQGSLRGGGDLDPTFTLGVFRAESSKTASMGGNPLPDAEPLDLTTLGRFSVAPAGQEIAVVGQLRSTDVNQAAGRHRFWAAGADTTIDVPFETTGLRIWAETYLGSSWVDHVPDDKGATFLEARALFAYRFGGLTKGETYVEPFLAAGVLEPDMNTVDDVFVEGMGGVAVGYWRQARLTLQVEYAKRAKNFPASYWIVNAPINNHLGVILEAGAAF